MSLEMKLYVQPVVVASHMEYPLVQKPHLVTRNWPSFVG
jgi:hypothetical protein